jgi:hypothetical protein
MQAQLAWARSVVMAAALILAAPALAAPITWDLDGGSSGVSGSAGNARTFTGTDLQTDARVTAWSRLGTNAATTITSAFLGHFSPGLGVTASNENGSGTTHTMDNSGGIDLIMLAFESAVTPSSVVLTPYGSSGQRDSDISVWIGSVVNPMSQSLAGMTLAQLDSSFTRLADNTTTSGSARTASFNPGNVSGNILIFAAVLNNDSKVDQIKVGELVGTLAPVASAVSAPHGLPLFALTLGVLWLATRRRGGAASAS